MNQTHQRWEDGALLPEGRWRQTKLEELLLTQWWREHRSEEQAVDVALALRSARTREEEDAEEECEELSFEHEIAFSFLEQHDKVSFPPMCVRVRECASVRVCKCACVCVCVFCMRVHA